MKIAPATQYNNHSNFKGLESKYSPKVVDAINSSIKESFKSVLPEITEKTETLGPIYDKITDGIGHVIGRCSNTKISQKCVSALSHFKKPSARMADLASFAITFFYVNNTRKSEKIPEERKMPLMVNNITVTAVSSTMAALIDKASDVFLDRVKGAFYEEKGTEVLDKVIKKAPEVLDKGEKGIKELGKDILSSKEFRKGLKQYTKGVEKAKSLTIFAFTVRFLVTVLMVPVAGKIVQIIKEKTAQNKAQQPTKEGQPKETTNKEETKQTQESQDIKEEVKQTQEPQDTKENTEAKVDDDKDDKEEDDD